MKKCFQIILAVIMLFVVGCHNLDEPTAQSTISIRQKPVKLIYEYGEQLDLTGIKVFKNTPNYYGGSSSAEIIGWTSNPKEGSKLLERGTIAIEIEYDNTKTSFDVEVIDSSYFFGVKADSFFWGTWVRMDNGEEYEVLETSIKQNYKGYGILFSDENRLEVQELGEFKRESDCVMVCDNIPYFRKGGTNLEYSLKLVGFSSSLSRAANGIRGRGKSAKYPDFESNGIIDSNDIIKLTAPTLGDIQTVYIENDGDTVVVPGLNILNSNDFMGTVAFVGKNNYNLKITGTISEEQKENGYLYGNNAKSYDMVLTITNISKNKCPFSICTIESADPRLSLTSSSNISALPISTMAAGASKTVNLTVSFGAMTEPFVDTRIKISIKNTKAGQEWDDYVPLRFYKEKLPITVAAKNPEGNMTARLNGFVIYPDGNNQYFNVQNNSSKTLYVPSFGSDKEYMMVFSGATVSTDLYDSTEMYYSVVPCSTEAKPVNLSTVNWQTLLSYQDYGGDNHSEATAFSAETEFIAYLCEGEIDYYTIRAFND